MNEAVVQAEAPNPVFASDESDTDSSSPTVVRYGSKLKSSGNQCPYGHPGQPKKVLPKSFKSFRKQTCKFFMQGKCTKDSE
eukprot:2042692-Karenia_brevis.AAC.1